MGLFHRAEGPGRGPEPGSVRTGVCQYLGACGSGVIGRWCTVKARVCLGVLPCVCPVCVHFWEGVCVYILIH